jgi:hypothetical protein
MSYYDIILHKLKFVSSLLEEFVKCIYEENRFLIYEE